MKHVTRQARPARFFLLALAMVILFPTQASAAWIWDKDSNRIDDRIEMVHRTGLAAAFEQGDPTKRLLIAVEPEGELLRYGVYVGYPQQPANADLAALSSSGVSTAVFHPFRTIPYVQMSLTFAEIARVAALPGVQRVEAVEMVYPVNNVATKTSGAVASNFRRFPTVQGNLAITGKGVVISILDTGVNDVRDDLTGFPGHEAFSGKFVAGGNFYSGQPALNTPPEQSENPVDRGADSVHGSHVAGTALGTGGPTGVFGGVAPASKLVDQKVLSDAGAGFGSAAGVEWAILNKEKYGIRVLNLSLGGLTNSDGTDAGSQAINAAFDAGIIAVVATGNDEATGYIASPSAADKAFSIGSLADQNSLDRADDLVASYSNEGPRLSDGDADFTDEMKPLVSAPGSGIISADGLLVTDGKQYKSLSGTSMATPHVAGIVALILEANPALTPQQVWDILKHTSEHRSDWGKTPASSRPFSSGDPNYHPSGGWGQVDAYAAVKEALRLKGDPASQTQVVSITATPNAEANAVDLTWRSQREINLAGYDILRADDVSGAPGTFVKVNASAIAGTGSAVIEQTNNRNTYTWRDTGVAAGRTYWYRISHTSSDSAIGTIHEPPIAVSVGRPKPVARIHYSITHNAIDNDLLVLIGTGPQAERAKFVVDGKSALQADTVTVETAGEATTGNRRHDFSIDLTSIDRVEAFLPPSEQNPWFVSVKEGGYVNRNGRLDAFSITLFDADGNPTATYSTKDLTPQRTVEGETTLLWIADDPNTWLPGDSPTVTEVSPQAAAAGASNVKVSVFGAEFTPGANVTFGGSGITVQSTEYKSGSELLATISIAPDAAGGSRNVTVTNVDGRSHSLNGAFTILGGSTGCTPSTTVVDDNDAAVEYVNGWHLKEDAGASAGVYHWKVARGGNNDRPATARMVFTGSQVTVQYGTSSDGGTVEVFIDGAPAGTISHAGSTKKVQFGSSVTFGSLAEGSHELTLVLRSGGAYLDGFVVASCQTAAADASAPQSRSETTVSAGQAGALSGVLLRTVQVGSTDESLSVLVESASAPVTVNVVNPFGTVAATGRALPGSLTLSGIDAYALQPGTYTVQVLNTSTSAQPVTISVARTVRVR
jgi:subtilisin family serine protease